MVVNAALEDEDVDAARDIVGELCDKTDGECDTLADTATGAVVVNAAWDKHKNNTAGILFYVSETTEQYCIACFKLNTLKKFLEIKISISKSKCNGSVMLLRKGYART